MLPLQEEVPEMGTSRETPRFLARKLVTIRRTIDGGLSQEELVRRLGLEDGIDRTYVSKYETGVLEPPLKVLLRYAALAGVHLEVLADDELELPDKLPCVPKSEGIKKKGAPRKGRQ
jgi:transcriptional regulator with XRE-family HTH domain